MIRINTRTDQQMSLPTICNMGGPIHGMELSYTWPPGTHVCAHAALPRGLHKTTRRPALVRNRSIGVSGGVMCKVARAT